MNKIFRYIENIFKYKPNDDHSFTITSQTNSPTNTKEDSTQNSDEELKLVSKSLSKNLDFLKSQYNIAECKDVMVREFALLVHDISYKAFIIYIDGMVDSNIINDFVLSPLMIRNKANTFDGEQKK